MSGTTILGSRVPPDDMPVSRSSGSSRVGDRVAHRFGEAGRARAGRRGRTDLASVTSGPKRTRHGRDRGAERSAGRDRDGDDRRVRHRLHAAASGGVPGAGAQPRRRERDRDEMAGARARATGRARCALIAPRRRVRPPTNGSVGRADDAQPATGRASHRDAERGRLDDAEAAVRDEHRADRSRARARRR